MSLRIRQIKGDYWLDKDLHTKLTADAREFYIGLWQYADDAGYMDWSVDRIAAALYPWRTPAYRERHVATWAQQLARLDPTDPHLILWDCGHAAVPKITRHQRIRGNQTFTVAERHKLCVSPKRLSDDTSLHVATDSPGRVGNGRERNGTVVARETESPTSGSEFTDRMAAVGLVRHRADH